MVCDYYDKTCLSWILRKMRLMLKIGDDALSSGLLSSLDFLVSEKGRNLQLPTGGYSIGLCT